MTKVSVIVPVYNASMNVRKCVESIINQTFSDYEIILINDGSSDNSIDILREYENKYSFIKVIDKKNEGVSKTRNLGISVAKSKYIMFVDNDDYIENDYIEKLYNSIVLNNSDCVYSGYKRENSKGQIIENKKIKSSNWSKYILQAPWAKIYKKSFLIKNNIKFLSYKIGEDVFFTMKLISKNAKITFIDYVGYVWYYNDASVSNTIQRGLKKEVDIIYLLNKINEYSDKNEYTSYYFYKYCVWYLLFSGKLSTSDTFYNEFSRYKGWLIENEYYKTISPFSKKLKGESLRDRFAVLFIKIIDRLHLVKLFSKIYCRGEKNEN